MAKLTEAQRQKIKEASQGLKKVTAEQEAQILDLYKNKDPRFEKVKKLVHKTVLYRITKDVEFAPKASRNERAEELNKILFQ